jgi:hypothetical protein
MALPLLNTPEFETTIPSNQQQIRFRPFLVKEEKILFMALQGNDPGEMTNAVKNILSACILDNNVDIEKLSISDVEYLFLKLRGKSVGEHVELNVRHTSGDCSHVSSVSINLDDINVIFPPQYTDRIQLTEEVGIQLMQPGINQAYTIDGDEDEFSKVMHVISECVVCIYDQENVYENFTKEEVVQFIENLNQEQFNKLKDFFANSPKLSYTIEWTCDKCSEHDSIEIKGLTSFFT